MFFFRATTVRKLNCIVRETVPLFWPLRPIIVGVTLTHSKPSLEVRYHNTLLLVHWGRGLRREIMSHVCGLLHTYFVAYCHMDNIILCVQNSFFPLGFCSAYDVDPSGDGDFDYTDDQTDTCYNQISNEGRCQLCIHRQSRDALRCLQHQILIQNTVSLW